MATQLKRSRTALQGGHQVLLVSTRAAQRSITQPSVHNAMTSNRRGFTAVCSTSRAAHENRNNAITSCTPRVTCLLLLLTDTLGINETLACKRASDKSLVKAARKGLLTSTTTTVTVQYQHSSDSPSEVHAICSLNAFIRKQAACVLHALWRLHTTTTTLSRA